MISNFVNNVDNRNKFDTFIRKFTERKGVRRKKGKV